MLDYQDEKPNHEKEAIDIQIKDLTKTNLGTIQILRNQERLIDGWDSTVAQFDLMCFNVF